MGDDGIYRINISSYFGWKYVPRGDETEENVRDAEEDVIRARGIRRDVAREILRGDSGVACSPSFGYIATQVDALDNRLYSTEQIGWVDFDCCRPF
jgi:transposase InsO family protein